MRADRIFDSVFELIGRTPLIRLSRLTAEGDAELCAKLEASNPTGSVKDRAALSMLQAAEAAGVLRPGDLVVEATSGNTGISLAMLSAVCGYRCMLVMPEDMATTRQTMLRAYGADMVLTPAHAGMRGAVDEAERIVRETPRAFMPRQFENPANPEIHERTTAEEILKDSGAAVDALVAGVGTGGTLTGVARALRARLPGVRVVAVEPKNSAVLSGGSPGLHALYGLGAGFIPPILDRTLIDEVIAVSDVDADRMTSCLARREGLLVGPSSGANVHAALQVARAMGRGKRVVTILCDTGERYL